MNRNLLTKSSLPMMLPRRFRGARMLITLMVAGSFLLISGCSKEKGDAEPTVSAA